jgi:hypothetical protein
MNQWSEAPKGKWRNRKLFISISLVRIILSFQLSGKSRLSKRTFSLNRSKQMASFSLLLNQPPCSLRKPRQANINSFYKTDYSRFWTKKSTRSSYKSQPMFLWAVLKFRKSSIYWRTSLRSDKSLVCRTRNLSFRGNKSFKFWRRLKNKEFWKKRCLTE